MSNPWLTLSSDLLHLLQKVLMTKDSNKSVICTHTHTLKCKHNSEEEEEKKIADKRQGIDAVGGKSQVYIFPFSLFSKDSETRFCGFIRVNCPGIYCFQSKSTINHLAHRLPQQQASTWTFCWPTNSTAYSMQQQEQETLYCIMFLYQSVISLFLLLLLSILLSFHPLRWCTVSRSQHPLSSKRSMSKAVIDFFLCVCVFFLYKDDIKVKHHLCNWIVFTES